MQGEQDCARETQVYSEFNELKRAIEHLQMVQTDLIGRLSQVSLEKSPPSPELKSDEVEQSIVPFADNLRKERKKVIMMADNIQDQMTRLEI